MDSSYVSNNCKKGTAVYLDNAATTKVDSQVLNIMRRYERILYGNASSKYSLGELSKKAIEDSRMIIASAINAEPSEIYFTSGGTEANNWVIKGLKNKYRFRPMHIISSEFEHHSVLDSIHYRANEIQDIEYTLVSPGKNGLIDVIDVSESFRLNTELCSVMMVNNELGTIQPIERIADKCKNNGIIFHTDAVQAFGQIPIDVKKNNISLMSFSSHKINGPKGIGALYISKEIKGRMNPLMHGGQQERKMRAGTENVPAIVGFGKATEIAIAGMAENEKKEKELQKFLLEQLRYIDGVNVNGDSNFIDPRHINIRIAGCRAEQLIGLFNEQKIFVSSGSACTSESNSPSHVLKAIGLSDTQANSSIRISIGRYNTLSDIDYFIDCLKLNIGIIRGM